MERRVLLTFKESRKPATLPPPSTTPDLLIVRECAQSLFTALEKEESHNRGVHTGMPNRFRSGLKPVSSIHTEISLAQTDLDPTHLAM